MVHPATPPPSGGASNRAELPPLSARAAATWGSSTHDMSEHHQSKQRLPTEEALASCLLATCRKRPPLRVAAVAQERAALRGVRAAGAHVRHGAGQAKGLSPDRRPAHAGRPVAC